MKHLYNNSGAFILIGCVVKREVIPENKTDASETLKKPLDLRNHVKQTRLLLKYFCWFLPQGKIFDILALERKVASAKFSV